VPSGSNQRVARTASLRELTCRRTLVTSIIPPSGRSIMRLLVITGFPSSNRHSVSENGDSLKCKGLCLADEA
jgi:hypothetical protein